MFLFSSPRLTLVHDLEHVRPGQTERDQTGLETPPTKLDQTNAGPGPTRPDYPGLHSTRTDQESTDQDQDQTRDWTVQGRAGLGPTRINRSGQRSSGSRILPALRTVSLETA